MFVIQIPFAKFAPGHLGDPFDRLVDIRLVIGLGFQGLGIAVLVISDDPGGHGQPLSK